MKVVMAKQSFEGRIWIRGDEFEGLDIWVWELFPTEIGKRSATDWIIDAASEYDAKWWRELIPEADRGRENLQVLFKGTIKGWQSYEGEYDESFDIHESLYTVLPDDWFDETKISLE